MSNVRNPYRSTHMTNLDATGALQRISAHWGTDAMPLPAGIDPTDVQMIRHGAASLYLALRRVNAVVEAAMVP